jgi:hypothetical protein
MRRRISAERELLASPFLSPFVELPLARHLARSHRELEGLRRQLR